MAAVSFVADDLTGAADVLAQAHRYGLDAVLVLAGGETTMPTDADVVGTDSLGPPDTLTLAETMRGAAETNLDLAAANLDVASGRQNVRLARSNLLPQIESQFGETFTR